MCQSKVSYPLHYLQFIVTATGIVNAVAI